MGINGLLPALKPIAKQVHISKYKGYKAAVDGYSWLHKGAYCCAKELCEGQWTDKFVTYFMSRIQLLRSNGIEPVVVFDGGRLPIKGQEEQSRHRARQEARDKAAAHLAAGNVAAAVECYQRCVDITPRMAKQVIEDLKAHGVAYIVAPYEADAQMAYLIKQDHVQLIITEDSDLLAYACPRVLYKLDRNGSGEEISISDLPHCSSLPLSSFTSDQFLQLCVMAGCDFLSQLPGIGLKKAHGLLRKYRSFTKVLKILRFNGTKVPAEYEVRFQMALWAFRHCRVYCPTAKAIVHLAPLPAGGLGAADVDVPAAFQQLEQEQQHLRLDFLGPDLPNDLAQGIAEGRLDPNSHKPFDLAAIFAGCKTPAQHILAQLHAASAAVPHLLAYNQRQHQGSNGIAAASGGSRSGAAAPAAASGAGRASSGRVGLSKKHGAHGHKKLSWQAVAALTDNKASKAGTAGTSSDRKKATLGIAKFFSAPRAASKDAEDHAVPGQTTAEETVAAAAVVTARGSTTVELKAASVTNMQNSIKQALQALQQQQQQRQQQQESEKQRLLSEIKAHEQQEDAMPEPASAADKTAGPAESDAFGTHAAKRRRLQEDCQQQAAGRIVHSVAVAATPAAVAAADSLSNFGVISSLPCQQEQRYNVHDINSIDLALSHVHPLGRTASVSPAEVAATVVAGRSAAKDLSGDTVPLNQLTGSAGLASGDSSNLVGSPAADILGNLDQNGRQPAGNSILPGGANQVHNLPSNDCCSILQTRAATAAGGTGSQSTLGSLGLNSSSLNPSLDSSTGVPAASGGRGAAVSALTALFRGPQQQPHKTQTAAQRLFNSGIYADNLTVGDDDFLCDLQQKQGHQQGNVLFSSSCPSGGMLGSGPCGSLPGSDNMLGYATCSSSQGVGSSGVINGSFTDLQQQPRPDMQRVGEGLLPSSLGHQSAVNNGSSSLFSPQCTTQLQQRQDDGEPEVVSPPRPHDLAVGGRNQQTWKQLQQTLRAAGGLRTGLKRSAEPVQPGSSLQRLKTEFGLGVKRSWLSHQADSSVDRGLCADGDVCLGSGFSLSDAMEQDAVEPLGAAVATAAASNGSDSLGVSGRMKGSMDGCQQQQLGRLNGFCADEQGTQQQQHHDSKDYITIPDSEGEDDYGINASAAAGTAAGIAAAVAAENPADKCQGQQADVQQADGTGGSSTDGSSLNESNDENATPDIHSIAHIRKYAKLAAKVVNKVQQQQEVKQRTQQQQQQQQAHGRHPLAAANTAAVLGNCSQQPAAMERPANRRSSQALSRADRGVGGNQQRSKNSRGKQQPARRKSLAADVAGLKYDPSMFVPVQALPDELVATKTTDPDHDTLGHMCANQTVTTSCTLNRDTSRTLLGVGLKPQNRVQGMFAKALASNGAGTDAAAAKPFKAPWLSQKVKADNGSKQQSVGVFGAFESFACGSARAGSRGDRRLPQRLGPR